MVKILFVCHGNICRSPMAEFMFRDMVEKAGLDGEFKIASAATSYEEVGNGVYPPARKKLAEHGIGCAGHAAHRMTLEEYDEYDLIICMDAANLRNLRRMTDGDSEGKISLVLDHCGRAGQEVADPWYTGDFESTWQDLSQGLSGLLEELTGKKL